MKKWPVLSLILAEGIFFTLKVLGIQFRFGDPTAYWYMAHAVSQGVLPYKDFFLADPPVFLFFLVPIVWLVGKHLIFLQLVPPLLEMATAALLFLYCSREKLQFAWLAPWVYLFSFTILSTSDYGTGLQLATLLFVTGSLFAQSKRWYTTGIFFALSVLTKLYVAPLVLGCIFWLVLQKKSTALVKITAAGVLTTAVCCLPFVFLDHTAFFRDTLLHHFSRPLGVSKISVFLLFFMLDGYGVALTAISGYFYKRNWFLLPLLFELLFFALFQDVYYAYLGILIPFVSYFTVLFFEKVPAVSELQKNIRMLILTTGALWLVVITGVYLVVYYPQGISRSTRHWSEVLSLKKDAYPVYGSHEVAPLIALRANKQIFQNIIDTNLQTFGSGVHAVEPITAAALRSGVYLVTRVYFTAAGRPNSFDAQRYFTTEAFTHSCELVGQDTVSADHTDGVAVFFCKEKN